MKAFEESKMEKPKDPIMYAIHYEQINILQNIEAQINRLKSKANQILPIEEDGVGNSGKPIDGECIVVAFELITRKLNELDREIVNINNHLDRIF